MDAYWRENLKVILTRCKNRITIYLHSVSIDVMKEGRYAKRFAGAYRKEKE